MILKNQLKSLRVLSNCSQRYYAARARISEVIDMRSDTVTRPSKKMKEVMTKCALGDDVYGDDPTVNYMQESLADFFGKEAAIYMPSGT